MQTKQKDQKIPRCIGFIMDGNRRWAKEKGLPTLQGHLEGYNKLKDVVRWAGERGVKNVIVYAFSTENWERSEEEVSYLMDLLKKALVETRDELKDDDVRISVLGQRDRLREDIQKEIQKTEEETKGRAGVHLGIALSYGGRPEIIDAVNAIVVEGGEISEKTISKHLWTSEFPEPDSIVRTGGEKRLSNFLTWGSVYSELFFTNTFWPDFSELELDEILEEYANRERRRGK